jgi:ribosomal protein S27E
MKVFSSSRRMHKIKVKCNKCKNSLFITNLSGKIYCKICGEYKDESFLEL